MVSTTPLNCLPSRKNVWVLQKYGKAEKQLVNALNHSGRPWDVGEEDSAFYGRKIDIILKDSKGKNYQCATIQLDFNLPESFDLTYHKSDGTNGRSV